MHTGGGGANALYSSLPGGYWSAGQYVTLCKNYNIGKCTNQAGNCTLPTGTKAHHLCAAKKANGDVCKEQHPAYDHK
jgi:hypothetical protein